MVNLCSLVLCYVMLEPPATYLTRKTDNQTVIVKSVAGSLWCGGGYRQGRLGSTTMYMEPKSQVRALGWKSAT